VPVSRRTKLTTEITEIPKRAGGRIDTRQEERPLAGFEEGGEADGDGGPGEMLAVGEGVLLAEAGAEFGIGQDANERVIELVGIER